MPWFVLGARLLALSAAAVACTPACDRPVEPTAPTRLCVREAPSAPCRAPNEVEALLRQELEILGSEPTAAGRQGARILTLATQHRGRRTIFRAKWRALSTEHGLNDPRKDLAAYALQKTFLAPEDYVVPPTAAHCFDLQHYRARVNAREKPTFSGTQCVFGILAYWLEGATNIDAAERAGLLARRDRLLDSQRLAASASYRRSLEDMNLLNHLISNGDTHLAQFVFTGGRADLRVYCVDYTISLSEYRNPKLRPDDDWSRLHVPAVPKTSLARVTRLRAEDVHELAVIEQFERAGGKLLPVPKAPPSGELEKGLRWRGDQLQIGLNTREIEFVWRRVERLVNEAAGRGQRAGPPLATF